jgi:DNA repair protein RadC
MNDQSKKAHKDAKEALPEYVSNIRLVRDQSPFSPVLCTSSEAAYDFARELFQDDLDIYESFYVLFLNRGNYIMDYVKLSQGGISGTVVDCRLVLKYALDTLASGVILVHNHPSGNLSPSKADKDLTNKLAELLKHFEIQVLDHIIITMSSYYSFADNGGIYP